MRKAERLHADCAGASRGAPATTTPFDGRAHVHERDRPFDVTHLALDLDLDVLQRRVRGTTRLELARRDASARELTLDAVGFELGEVTLDGASVAPRYDGEHLTVEIPEGATRFVIEVKYEVAPKRGLFFMGPDDAVPDRPVQVWTQCQDEDARHWFVCHDKPHMKHTTELTARVPEGWYLLSNGDLVSHAQRDGVGEWHYRLDVPHPSYLMTLVAGEFEVVPGGTAGAAKIPLTYVVPRGRAGDVARSLGRTGAMIDAFEARLGVPYPFRSYTQIVVTDFSFGGMENTTATTLYEHALYDEEAALDVTSDDLVAHELGHQWFGDLVTCRDFAHGWLNEGFATYMEHLDREVRLGLDEYHHFLDRDQRSYLDEAASRYTRALVEDRYEAPIDVFDRHLYEKGGLVVHLLRMELGDAAFFAGLQAYLTRHAHGVVETRDLQRALEDSSGRSLGAFFAQWVARPGHAKLRVGLTHEKGKLIVTTRQETTPFVLPLELAVVTASGARTVTLELTNQEAVYAVAVDGEPMFVVVDPRHRILGECTVDLPLRWSERQLEGAPTARGRWLAARALAHRDETCSVARLAKTLQSPSEHWTVRSEAAQALATRRGEPERDALLALGRVEDARVRRAVAEALGKLGRAGLEPLRRLAEDRAQLVAAEALRALGEARAEDLVEIAERAIVRRTWSEVVAAAALEALGKNRVGEAIVRAQSRYGIPTRARRAAVHALAKFGPSAERRDLLTDLLRDREAPLRQDAALALAELRDVDARGALAEALVAEREPRVRTRMREALRALTGDEHHELKRLGGEVESLRAELATLRGRLAKLEAPDEPA